MLAAIRRGLMIIPYARPVSHASFWARRLALLGLLVCIAALLAHRFGPLITPHFLFFQAVGSTLCAVAVALALIGFVQLWRIAAKGGLAAFTALVLAAPPLAAVVYSAVLTMTRPALYEVTTDTSEPLDWLHGIVAEQGWLGSRPPSSLRAVALQREAYPGLVGRRYEGALDRVLEGVKAVALMQGLVIEAEPIADADDTSTVSPTDEPLIAPPVTGPVPAMRPGLVLPLATPAQTGPRPDVVLQGVWREPVTGLPVDAVIRLREEAETTLVDMRAASRYGQRDLGLSADFAMHYLRALDAQLQGIAGD